MNILKLIGQTAAWLFLCLVETAMAQPTEARAAQPNKVLLVVDDTALMNFAAYGGEAHTPTIDRLARKGAMFLNYHMRWPSRAWTTADPGSKPAI